MNYYTLNETVDAMNEYGTVPPDWNPLLECHACGTRFMLSETESVPDIMNDEIVPECPNIDCATFLYDALVMTGFDELARRLTLYDFDRLRAEYRIEETHTEMWRMCGFAENFSTGPIRPRMPAYETLDFEN